MSELVDGRFVPAVLNWYKFVSAAPREKRLTSTLLTRGMVVGRFVPAVLNWYNFV